MCEHTKLPWDVFTDSDDIVYIEAPGGELICDLTSINATSGGNRACSSHEEEVANGEFIVRACNCHEELLAACKLGDESGIHPLISAARLLRPDWPGLARKLQEKYEKEIAAIAKAKGGD